MVGISIDYTYHYICEIKSSSTSEDRLEKIKILFPALSLGFVTTAISFAMLFITPLPGLRQIAVFSIFGLLGAFLTVVSVFPRMRVASPKLVSKTEGETSDTGNGYSSRVSKLNAFMEKLPRIVKGTMIVFTVIAVPALFFLKTDDNVRNLQSLDKGLKYEDDIIKKIVGDFNFSAFFVTEASNKVELLEKENLLVNALNKIAEPSIDNYISVSAMIPPVSAQSNYYHRFLNMISKSKGQLNNYFAEMGFGLNAQAFIQQNNKTSFKAKSLSEWESMSFAAPYRYLVSSEKSVCYSITPVNDELAKKIKNNKTAFSDFIFVNRINEFSNVLMHHRVAVSIWTMIAYVFIGLLLFYLFGMRRGFLILLPSLLSVIFTLGLLSWFGVPITLFHVFGLIIVLGIGVDYTIFYFLSKNRSSTQLAIFLSALSTILSFGLLSLSGISFLNYLGQTILIGILFSFILAPLAGKKL